MTRFEQHRRFLTRGVMSLDIAEREAIAREVRRQADFFTGFSEDEEALLRDIWSDLLNGTSELAFAGALAAAARRLERFRRMGIDEAEARIYAGLGAGQYRSASEGPRRFEPTTPEELATYED